MIYYVVFLMQTEHRDTLSSRLPDLSVCRCGVANCWLVSIVVSQKLSLLAKCWQVPPSPLHSMNGLARKSSKHEPGLAKAWPPPCPPAPVCCYKITQTLKLKIKIDRHRETKHQADYNLNWIPMVTNDTLAHNKNAECVLTSVSCKLWPLFLRGFYFA